MAEKGTYVLGAALSFGLEAVAFGEPRSIGAELRLKEAAFVSLPRADIVKLEVRTRLGGGEGRGEGSAEIVGGAYSRCRLRLRVRQVLWCGGRRRFAMWGVGGVWGVRLHATRRVRPRSKCSASEPRSGRARAPAWKLELVRLGSNASSSTAKRTVSPWGRTVK